MEIGHSNILVDAATAGRGAKIRRLARRLLEVAIGPQNYYCLWFRHRHGYFPNLRSPIGYNEKLLWLSLKADLEPLSQFTDKWLVRRYVTEKVGPSVLVPTYIVIEDVRQIPPLRSLPNTFVMKAAHGSHMTLIVKEKSELDERAFHRLCARWLSTNYYSLTGERVYKECRPRVLIEPLLSPPNGELIDYKFLCYQGEPRFVDVHTGRFGDHREEYYDADWNRLPIRESLPGFGAPIARPRELNDMLCVACALSSEFTFVRVDLYAFDGKVYFGELTFIPANARSPIRPREYERILGEGIPVQRQIWVKNRTSGR